MILNGRFLGATTVSWNFDMSLGCAEALPSLCAPHTSAGIRQVILMACLWCL